MTKPKVVYVVDDHAYDIAELRWASEYGCWHRLKGPLKTDVKERVRAIIWLQTVGGKR